MIFTINENKVVNIALDADGKKKRILATATRKSPGSIWNIWYADLRKDTTRSETVHARVSGKLPAEQQSRMIVQLLDLADH